MKKLLAILLCVLMISSILVVNAAAEDKVEITYSYWGTPEEAASVQAVADKFNSEQDRIHVTVLAIPNEEYTTTLNSMAAGNQLPDCGIMNENGVLDFAADGLLADISSMYKGAASMPLDAITEMLSFRSRGPLP